MRRVFEIIGIGAEEAEARFGFLLDALRYGAPPHGGIAMGLDRIVALLAGRDFVLPDDIKRFLVPCWGHRIIVRAESELEGQTAAQVLLEAVNTIEVPRR